MKLVNRRKRVQCPVERRTRVEGKAGKNQAGKKIEASHILMVANRRKTELL